MLRMLVMPALNTNTDSSNDWAHWRLQSIIEPRVCVNVRAAQAGKAETNKVGRLPHSSPFTGRAATILKIFKPF